MIGHPLLSYPILIYYSYALMESLKPDYSSSSDEDLGREPPKPKESYKAMPPPNSVLNAPASTIVSSHVSEENISWEGARGEEEGVCGADKSEDGA
jgi:hypothetical protein